MLLLQLFKESVSVKKFLLTEKRFLIQIFAYVKKQLVFLFNVYKNV